MASDTSIASDVTAQPLSSADAANKQLEMESQSAAGYQKPPIMKASIIKPPIVPVETKEKNEKDLVKIGIPPPFDDEIPSKYYQRIKGDLSRNQLRHLVSKDNSNIFWVEFREAVIRACNLRGVPVDYALRLVCSKVPFPAEGQQVDRFAYSVAKVYFEENPNVFCNIDNVYFLLFGLIVLNTAKHNVHSRVKTSRKQFIDQFRYMKGFQDDVSSEMLKALYQSVKNHMIVGADENLDAFNDLQRKQMILEDEEEFGVVTHEVVEFLKGSDFERLWQHYPNYAAFEVDSEAVLRAMKNFEEKFQAQDQTVFFDHHFSVGEWLKYGQEFVGKRKLLEGIFPEEVETAVKVGRPSTAATQKFPPRPSSSIAKGPTSDKAIFRSISMVVKPLVMDPPSPMVEMIISTKNVRDSWILARLDMDLRQVFYGSMESPLRNASFLLSVFYYAQERLPIAQRRTLNDGTSSKYWASLVSDNKGYFAHVTESSNFKEAFENWRLNRNEKTKLLYSSAVLQKTMYKDTNFNRSLDRKWHGYWACISLSHNPAAEGKVREDSLELPQVWFYAANKAKSLKTWFDDKLQDPNLEAVPPKATKQRTLYHTVAYRDKTYTKYNHTIKFTKTSTPRLPLDLPDERSFSNEGSQMLLMTEGRHYDSEEELREQMEKEIVLKNMYFKQSIESEHFQTRIPDDQHQLQIHLNICAAVNTILVDLFKVISRIEGSWLKFETAVLFACKEQIVQKRIRLSDRRDLRRSEKRMYPFMTFHDEDALYAEEDRALNFDEESVLVSRNWVYIREKVEGLVSEDMMILIDALVKIRELDSNHSSEQFELTMQAYLVLFKWLYLNYNKEFAAVKVQIDSETRKLNQLELALISSRAVIQEEPEKEINVSRSRRSSVVITPISPSKPVMDPGARDRKGVTALHNTIKAAKEIRRGSLCTIATMSSKDDVKDEVVEIQLEQTTTKLASQELNSLALESEEIKVPVETKPAPTILNPMDYIKTLKQMKSSDKTFTKCQEQITFHETRIEWLRIEHEKWKVYTSVLTRIILAIEAQP